MSVFEANSSKNKLEDDHVRANFREREMFIAALTKSHLFGISKKSSFGEKEYGKNSV
jgi:hypothetical protein